MDRKTLEFIDEAIYNFLEQHVDVMPRRLGKMIALYYTDARIRKKYSRFIGVEMGEGTFANLGLYVVPNENEVCVKIGKNVSIAPNVTFLAGSEPNNGDEIKNLSYVRKKNIRYEDVLLLERVVL